MTSWELRQSEAFEVTSKAAGITFAIGVVTPGAVALPMLDTQQDAFHVAYLLDGTLLLPMAAVVSSVLRSDVLRPGFPPLLLVGIDYPEGTPNRRSYDYTAPDSVWPGIADLADTNTDTKMHGGADDFLTFLEDELDPLIRMRYPVAGSTAGLFGMSYGGSFTFHAFLRQSRLFDKYWFGSPGISALARHDYLADFDTVLSRELVHDTRMFLSLGQLEADGAVEYYADMGVAFKRVVDIIDARANGQLTARSVMYPDHTHMSVLAPSFGDALRYLYEPAEQRAAIPFAEQIASAAANSHAS